MNYGLYLSASGALTSMYRQDVFANNLANVHTVGYKPDYAMISQRAPASVETGAGFEQRKNLLDRLGGGVFAGPQSIDLSPASLSKTSRDLDVALEQENAFFAVSVRLPNSGRTEIQLTRDGRFIVDNEGFLAMIGGGHRVLDTEDEPIQLNTDAPAVINDAGSVLQNGVEVARLQVSSVSDVDRLVKQGGNLLGIDGKDDLRRPVDQPMLRHGFLEASGVDPIKALMSVIDATKSATANGNMIRYHDMLMDRAVNVLGRVLA